VECSSNNNRNIALTFIYLFLNAAVDDFYIDINIVVYIVVDVDFLVFANFVNNYEIQNASNKSMREQEEIQCVVKTNKIRPIDSFLFWFLR
jgi:hypothetical protein